VVLQDEAKCEALARSLYNSIGNVFRGGASDGGGGGGSAAQSKQSQSDNGGGIASTFVTKGIASTIVTKMPLNPTWSTAPVARCSIGFASHVWVGPHRTFSPFNGV
jgi:hypothetical protein